MVPPSEVTLPPALPDLLMEILLLWTAAEQLEEVPPLLPLHVQFHGPLPVTVEAVPAVQRFVEGIVIKVCPLLLPQEPLTESMAKLAVMLSAAVTLPTVNGLLVVVVNPLPVQLTK